MLPRQDLCNTLDQHIFTCYYYNIPVTHFEALYSMCYCLSFDTKCCVTVISLVTHFSICYMIVLLKVCFVVVGRRSSGSPRGEQYEGSLVRLRCEAAVAAE